MTSFNFAEWPPALTDAQLETLVHHATTYALAHGLAYLPPAPTQPPAPSSAIHAPISLLPAPVPRSLFYRAQKLQSLYNKLYARVAMDDEFLDRVMGAVDGVGRADEFTGTLWRGWKQIRDEGIVQPFHLGLFRSDYLLHTHGEEGGFGLKQVEFNTISSSFGTLSERAAAMHRYLHAVTGYYGVSSNLKAENFPPNNTTSGLAEGLASAHRQYIQDRSSTDAYILFVVQPNERNVFDQRWLEYELLDKHAIRVIRQTFDELASSATLDPQSRVLRINLPTLHPSSDLASPQVEISTIYFRAGYVPSDFPTPAHYETRITLERSAAIKCPTIPLQLAGGKKVQEVLSQEGVVEKFLKHEGADASTEMRQTWMRMWALDDERPPLSPAGGSAGNVTEKQVPGEPLGTSLARANASRLVLKPQREGGGNNVYKSDIPSFLESLPPRDREAWIAMELIVPPAGVGGYLVRAGGANNGNGNGNTAWADKIVRTETISELGIFGWALFSREDGIKENGDVGWLMRTKGVESNEGGVAAGFSVLDSVVLVDG
ncbi:glutathione synthase [Phlebopus sp. FC_14]|nr:glutathione synthase [Phlebopus sp. FC_14]